MAYVPVSALSIMLCLYNVCFTVLSVLSVTLCDVVYAAAHLLQRVGTPRPQTAPGTPLSFGSPAHDVTPQWTAVGGEVIGSVSETARRVDAVLSPHIQMTGSVAETTRTRKAQQVPGML